MTNKKRIGTLDYLKKRFNVEKELTLLNAKAFDNADIFNDEKGGSEKRCLYAKTLKV